MLLESLLMTSIKEVRNMTSARNFKLSLIRCPQKYLMPSLTDCYSVAPYKLGNGWKKTSSFQIGKIHPTNPQGPFGLRASQVQVQPESQNDSANEEALIESRQNIFIIHNHQQIAEQNQSAFCSLHIFQPSILPQELCIDDSSFISLPTHNEQQSTSACTPSRL